MDGCFLSRAKDADLKGRCHAPLPAVVPRSPVLTTAEVLHILYLQTYLKSFGVLQITGGGGTRHCAYKKELSQEEVSF